jgi:hypothetical protein
MSLVERCCSYCGKITWDSDNGKYTEETHVNKKTGKEEKCDANGAEYTSSDPEDD